MNYSHVNATHSDIDPITQQFISQMTGFLNGPAGQIRMWCNQCTGNPLSGDWNSSIVAPWTVRARPGAHVATPLHWAEVEDPSLSPPQFTLRTAPERLATVDDPWAGLSRRRYDVDAARDRLAKIAKA